MKHIDEMTEDGLEGLNGAGFWALISRTRGRPIFPHLQRVSSIQLRHMRTYEPIFLLSPALREAKVVIPVDNEHVYPCKDCQDLMVHKVDITMGPLLRFLHLQSPHLTSLHVAFSNPAPDLKAEDVRSMSLFKSLRQLDIDLRETTARIFELGDPRRLYDQKEEEGPECEVVAHFDRLENTWSLGLRTGDTGVCEGFRIAVSCPYRAP